MTHPIVIIVQARMSSERLPGKVMKLVLGKPLLGYVINQLRRVKLCDELVIATSTGSEEAPIVDLCQKMQVSCFRGDLHDVLSRYVAAAEANRAQTIVRICADCPLIDPAIVDQVIHTYLTKAAHVDYVSNCQKRSFPRGQDVEVFSRKALDEAANNAQLPEEREHVTPYLYRHPEHFRIADVIHTTDLSSHRWVVDTADDFQFISHILTELYPLHPQYCMQDVLKILDEHSDWKQINAHVQQRGLKQ